MQDRIYEERGGGEDFVFDGSVAAVFDNMVERSVPGYREVLELEARLVRARFAAGDLIYDLGCSTGNGLLAVARTLGETGFRGIGIDSSGAMLERAREKAAGFRSGASLAFLEADANAVALEPCGAVLCNYTLQFIRPPRRAAFLEKIHGALRPGGMLLLAEKTLSHDPLCNRLFIMQGHDFKRERGYSDLEIARKREALENVLVPFTVEENLQLLRGAGFAHVELFFRHFNFAAFLAVKAGPDARG